MVQPLNHSAHGTVRPVQLAGCHTGQHLLGQIDVVLTSTGDSYSESQSWTGLGMGAVKAPTRNRPEKAKTPR